VLRAAGEGAEALGWNVLDPMGGPRSYYERTAGEVIERVDAEFLSD